MLFVTTSWHGHGSNWMLFITTSWHGHGSSWMLFVTTSWHGHGSSWMLFATTSWHGHGSSWMLFVTTSWYGHGSNWMFLQQLRDTDMAVAECCSWHGHGSNWMLFATTSWHGHGSNLAVQGYICTLEKLCCPPWRNMHVSICLIFFFLSSDTYGIVVSVIGDMWITEWCASWTAEAFWNLRGALQ
jgi:hypothetical protein